MNASTIIKYILVFMQSILSKIGIPNGIAGLDETGRVPVSQLPAQLPVACEVVNMELQIETQSN